MKTKKDFPYLSFFVAAALSVVAFLPLRIYQYFNILEAETGFYTNKDFSVYLMYALIAFVVIFNFSVAFLNKKNLKFVENNAEKSCMIAYIVAAIGFIIDAASKTISFTDMFNNYNYNFNQSAVGFLSQNGGVIILLEIIFAILSSVYFFVLAAGSLTNKEVASKIKIIALSPSLWASMRLLTRFKSTISFVNVSDLLIELFAIVFMMVFFFSFAMTTSKIDKGASYWKLFAYGIPSAVFAVACFIPRAVLSVVGHADLLAEGYSAQICDFTISILIFAYLISRANVSSNKKVG